MHKTIFVLICTPLFLSGCSLPGTTQPQVASEANQFNIYYSFGFAGEGNILDTKNNLYTKDMVCEEDVSYPLQLTPTQKDEIYTYILANNILALKDDFTKNCDENGLCQEMSPSFTSTIKITLTNTTKTIVVHGNYIDRNDPELKVLQGLETILQNIVSQKEQELHIPKAKCLYE